MAFAAARDDAPIAAADTGGALRLSSASLHPLPLSGPPGSGPGEHLSFRWRPVTARQLATVPALSEAVKAKEGANSAAEILIHPSGRFLYSSNRGHDTVTVYRADPATAALQVIQVQPVRGAIPRNINFAPGAGWLLAAGADSNTVSVHEVDPQSGELTYLQKGVINVPGAICIVFAKR